MRAGVEVGARTAVGVRPRGDDARPPPPRESAGAGRGAWEGKSGQERTFSARPATSDVLGGAAACVTDTPGNMGGSGFLPGRGRVAGRADFVTWWGVTDDV